MHSRFLDIAYLREQPGNFVLHRPSLKILEPFWWQHTAQLIRLWLVPVMQPQLGMVHIAEEPINRTVANLEELAPPVFVHTPMAKPGLCVLRVVCAHP